MMRSDSDIEVSGLLRTKLAKSSVPKDHRSDVEENGLVEHGLTRSSCMYTYVCCAYKCRYVCILMCVYGCVYLHRCICV